MAKGQQNSFGSKAKCIQRAGKLLRVPLEVFNEIASFLSVLDLQSLSRTCKGINNIMLSKNFRLVWRDALRDVNAPECLLHLNEPQFVELVFGTDCQECAVAPVKPQDYGMHMRLCDVCLSEKTVSGHDLLADTLGLPKADSLVLRLCYFYGGADLSLYLFDRAEGFIASRRPGIKNLSDEDLIQQRYLASEFTKVALEYHGYTEGSLELREFTNLRTDDLVSICSHAIAIDEWLQTLEMGVTVCDTPAATLKMQLRKRSIFEKLKQMGYSEDDFDVCENNPDWQGAIYQPHELTNELWRVIRPTLQSILIEGRNKRLHGLWDEVKQSYKAFYGTYLRHNHHAPALSFSDVERLTTVKSLVASIDTRCYFNELEWASLSAALVAANAEFEMRIKEKCLAAIHSARQAANVPCQSTNGSEGSMQRILQHASSFFLAINKSPSCRLRLKTYHAVLSSRFQGSRSMDVCPRVIKIAWALLRDLGLVEDVGMREMEKIHRQFVCRRCNSNGGEKMTWENLVLHFYRESNWYSEILKHNGCVRKKTFVDSHNVATTGKLAAVEPPNEPWRLIKRNYRCQICEDSGIHRNYVVEGSQTYIKAHVRTSHGKIKVAKSDYILC